MSCRERIWRRMGSMGLWAVAMAGRRMKEAVVLGLLLALLCGLAGKATAQPVTSLTTLDTSGVVGGTYTISGTISTILSAPAAGGINGIGGVGSSVVYTNAFYVTDGTTGIDVYGALPLPNTANNNLPGGTPAVGQVVTVTGAFGPYHQMPEMDDMSSIVYSGSTSTVPSPATFTIGGNSATNSIINDVFFNNVTNTSSGTTQTLLPLNLGGTIVSLNGVYIHGANTVANQPTFGTSDSPNGAYVSDGPNSTGGTCTFYYWPTSYSVANTNIANSPIYSGPVDMTGFVSLYGNTNIPEFSPISIVPHVGPPAYWEPSAGGNTWNGSSSLVWSASSGQQSGNAASAATNTAIFDDTGLNISGGSLVTISGVQSAAALKVSNSQGTYNLSGGTISVGQLNKTGAGTLLLNTTLQGTTVIASAGTLGGNGSILSGSLTVGSTAGGATFTPGATVSTVGEMTIGGNVNFSTSGTYLWKLGSEKDATATWGSGVAGTTWDELNLAGGGGLVNIGGSAQLVLSLPGAAGDSFWQSNHTWMIATSGATGYTSAPIIGAGITTTGAVTPSGTFTLAGDSSNDLLLKFTSAAAAPRGLLWSANGSMGLVDGSGTWSGAKWTDGVSISGGTFDSGRPDNATFGNSAGTNGTANIYISNGPANGVTVGSLTFNGSNAAQYTISGSTANASAGGYLTINNGVTANQSAYLGIPTGTYSGLKVLLLGYSQTWNVASGNLEVTAGVFSQATASSLTKTGTGTLTLNCGANYSGGTILNGGVLSVNNASWLPTSGVVTVNSGLLECNNHNQQIGALSGSGGTIDLGSNGCELQFGDASNQTFSGTITGGANSQLYYQGSGTVSLAGTSTFNGSVTVAAGELQASSDHNLGNSSNGVIVVGLSTFGATSTFSSSRTFTFGNTISPQGGNLDVAGSNTVLTLTGLVTGQGTLTKVGSGTLVLGNTGNNVVFALGTGTIAISNPADIGSNAFNFIGKSDGGCLQFQNSMTLSNNINLPTIGQKAAWFDTQGNNVTFTGNFIPPNDTYNTVAIYKIGSGTLNFAGAQPGPGNMGDVNVNQGVLELSTAVTSLNGPASSLGGSSGDYITVRPTGTLLLAGVQLGSYADLPGNATSLPTIELSSGTSAATTYGGTLLGSGSSVYSNGDITVALNYTGSNATNAPVTGGTATAYSASSVGIGTLHAGDVLSIQNAVRQTDAGDADAYVNNNYGNAVKTGPTTYASDTGQGGKGNKLVTINVTGPGIVQLQSGGVTSDETFGGAWSVGSGAPHSGTLEIGPYMTNVNSTNWSGPQGQLLNALGFETLDGQTYNGTSTVQGDPDMPNAVTLNSGGMLVVAVDQVNMNYLLSATTAFTVAPDGTVSGGTGNYGVNGTPDYLRNPIVLSGGTLAASGYEVTFGTQSYTNAGGGTTNIPLVMSSTTLVTAKLGGDFTVCAGTSTIDTYDPVGNTGARTVELLGGSRTLSNSTAAYTAGATLTYNTTWNGVLNVDGGAALSGGTFALLRDAGGGTVTVSNSAQINVLHKATVLVAGSDPYATLYDGSSGNSVNFNGGTGGGHLVFDSSASTLTYAGNISGNLDLAQDGSGLLVLSSADNTYNGGTTVNSGTLEVVDSGALPYASGLTVAAGGTVIFSSPTGASLLATRDLGTPAGAVAAVPEPASLALLLGFAGCGLGIWQWRRAKRLAAGPDPIEFCP